MFPGNLRRGFGSGCSSVLFLLSFFPKFLEEKWESNTHVSGTYLITNIHEKYHLLFLICLLFDFFIKSPLPGRQADFI